MVTQIIKIATLIIKSLILALFFFNLYTHSTDSAKVTMKYVINRNAVLDPSEFSQSHRLPLQRWQIFSQQPELASQLSEATGLTPILGQVLVNRGIKNTTDAQFYLNPDSIILPSPLDEFPDLEKSLKLLEKAINLKQKIAICGDYDADGMTSTALLLRALRWLGAEVDYAIPSRLSEGYGINRRIVEEFHSEGVEIILTVDNGISAYDPVDRARELGLKVIITDHHDIPEKIPPADAILNPKLIREDSPYRGVAGVGVAYILAISLAQKLDKIQGLITLLRALMTLGTIADLAPLTGVNRRWLKLGLRQLPTSELAGIQALMQVAGVQAREQGTFYISQENKNPKSLKPEDIGFRLGPRINAVGRIGDPQIVIDLLTTDDMGIALEKAMQCEQINQRRQQMCKQIEKEAVEWVENSQINLLEKRVLVIVQPNWHHGVIGIVASRLVERYGVPVFIGTNEDSGHIRGSARSIPEFHVFEALQFCDDLLGKYGGHRAAGGFSLKAENLQEFSNRLSDFAHSCLEPAHLKPLVEIDAELKFDEINFELYHQINALHPCGIENSEPVFWVSNVRVVEQRIVGDNHLKVTLSQQLPNGNYVRIQAMAWRWGEYFPLPLRVDVAYRLTENNWQGNTNLEIEIIGLRLPQETTEKNGLSAPLAKAEFYYENMKYNCALYAKNSAQELRIKTPEGKVLAVEKGGKVGIFGTNRENAMPVDVTKKQFFNLIKSAMAALQM
ncbi:MAG TPA: single-stranded-DNA-specific exonuclease RecJ [Halomicronema sp.]